MPKRIITENTKPTATPAAKKLSATVESPKKRGRPCKKLDPLPKDVMKALGILNNYVEKQQAQAQAQAQAEAASDSEVAAISSPEVSEETPPAKRKRGRPKKTKSPSPEVSEETPPVKRKRGRPKKPKSPSPDVSEEAKPKEDALACSPVSSPDEKNPKKSGSKKKTKLPPPCHDGVRDFMKEFKELEDGPRRVFPFAGPSLSVGGELVRCVSDLIRSHQAHCSQVEVAFDYLECFKNDGVNVFSRERYAWDRAAMGRCDADKKLVELLITYLDTRSGLFHRSNTIDYQIENCDEVYE